MPLNPEAEDDRIELLNDRELWLFLYDGIYSEENESAKYEMLAGMICERIKKLNLSDEDSLNLVITVKRGSIFTPWENSYGGNAKRD